MHTRGSAALVGCLWAATSLAVPADAAAPRTTRRAETLTAAPASRVTKRLRTQRQWTMSRTSLAWRTLAATGAWSVAWDRATGVPDRIWGSGFASPGASASPALAEVFARGALATHLALLAPGASVDDFVLVSNHSDGDIRAVGFQQRHGGRRVVGGQISFRFKRDRLFVIASEALPHVALPAALQTASLARTALRDRATPSLRTELGLPDASVQVASDEVILPLVGDDAVLGYRRAVPITVDGGAEGRYLAYADPATGETLAVHQLNLYASGKLLYRGVVRYPALPRVDRPAARARVTVDSVAQTTTSTGGLTWATGTVQVVTSVVGDLVAVVNKGTGGALAAAELTLADGGTAVWDASAVAEEDAQVQVFLNVNLAKDFARVLDPNMATLDEQLTANVNIAQDCNAFFDGKAVNFFHASKDCQNTGLIQDVVFHEYGHAVHTAEIIEGVGAFDGAMSEGAADFFAAQITGDPKMGRGFFFTDEPLRDLDPTGRENRWPDDIGEIHKTGIIFGGTFWDLRKALIAKLGEGPGALRTQQLFVGALRRSTSIPASLIEVLAEDDDDGNLDNGTPNECEIRAAYGAHGMRTATGTIDAPAVLGQETASVTARLQLAGLTSRCQGDHIDHVDFVWKPAVGTTPTPGSITATAVSGSPGMYTGALPAPRDGTLLYQARVVFDDESTFVAPDNLADPFYQLYEGTTVPLYCTDFEADPFANGWTTGTSDGTASPWKWGVSSTGATDPHAAFSGAHALIQAVDGDYEPKSSSYAKMPAIDIGMWTDVHLQYRRWLGVEDSHYDQARVTVNGKAAWVNFTQNAGDSSSAQHIDREWRFQDVALSSFVRGHSMAIAWDLTSDEGLQFGGWAIDDVCVVANTKGRCGDGATTVNESCDDGDDNADKPNACRTYCQLPVCGDAIVDDGEDCDPGTAGTDPDCTSTCKSLKEPDLGGCCSARRDAAGSLMLGVLTLGLVLRRRRRA